MSADPPRFETLDSLALAKGRQWSSQNAKTLEFARLRLRRKEQGFPSVAWPIDSDYVTTKLPADAWVRVVEPMVLAKCEVARLALCVATFIASDVWLLQFCSRAAPLDVSLNATGPRVVSIGSSPDVNDATGRVSLPLLAGLEEEVAVYARAQVGSQSLTMLGLAVTALRFGVT